TRAGCIRTRREYASAHRSPNHVDVRARVVRSRARCGKVLESGAFVQRECGTELAARFEEQLRAAERAVRVERTLQEQAADATAALRGRDRHLGQLEYPAALVLERDGADRTVVLVDREQDASAVGEYVGFRIGKHLTVDRFDEEPALQPLEVEPREVLAPSRGEVDDAWRSPGPIHVQMIAVRVRCAGCLL